MFTFDTTLYADEVEKVDVSGSVAIACATYQLNEATGNRDGRLFLFNSSFPDQNPLDYPSEGIYNMRWFQMDGETFLITACAKATLALYRFHAESFSLVSSYSSIVRIRNR